MNVYERPLLVDLEKCTGCLICETVCAMERGNDGSGSRIKILRAEELDINIPVLKMSCDLCGGNPLCAVHCPEDALECMDLGQALSVRKGMKLQKLFCPLISA